MGVTISVLNGSVVLTPNIHPNLKIKLSDQTENTAVSGVTFRSHFFFFFVVYIKQTIYNISSDLAH